MRLSSLKLAGFKSFADSTILSFPENRSAIVGPNGCGKSNVIDAIRWVMGESNARQLRGGSMQDVIFAGTTQRKPVGVASVELRFENTYGKLGGAYNAYTELSIKRQVTREGKSDYFLNGTRCRRKDITDIFLGTGLGPRSYAVIEQGMINRLVDAKPEEMRVFIEEAAGVSRYQVRRKETLAHLSHTQDNLARLNDILLELQSQIKSLKKQAAQAEIYQQLKTEIATYQLQSLSYQYHQYNQKTEKFTKQLTVLTTQYQDQKQDVQQIEIEEIILQKQIQQQLPQAEKLQQQWQKAQQQHQEVLWQLEQDQQQQNKLEKKIEYLQNQQIDLKKEETSLLNFLQQIEQTEKQLQNELAMADLIQQKHQQSVQELLQCVEKYQQDFEQQRAVLQQNTQQFKQVNYQLEQIQKTHLRAEQQRQNLQQQRHHLIQNDKQLELEELNFSLATLQLQLADQQQQFAVVQQQHQIALQNLEQLKQQQQQTELLQKNVQRDIKQTEKIVHDLQQQTYEAKHELLSCLKLSQNGQKYIHYIEKILNQWLFAETSSELNWQYQGSRQLKIIEQIAFLDKQTDLTHISDWIIFPQHQLWENIYIVESFVDAQNLIINLPEGLSLVSLDGYWLGKTWCINLNHHTKEGVNGQLYYYNHLMQLNVENQELIQKLIPLQQQCVEQGNIVKNLKDQLDQDQAQKLKWEQQYNKLTHQQVQLTSQLDLQQQQYLQLTQQLDQLNQHLTEDDLEKDQLQIEQVSLGLKIDELEPKMRLAQQKFEQSQHELKDIQQKIQQAQFESQQKSIQLEQQRAKQGLSQQDLKFKQERYTELSEQQVSCQQQQARLVQRVDQLISQESQTKTVAETEQQHWLDWKTQIEVMQNQQQQLNAARNHKQQQENQLRNQLEETRLQWQEQKTQQQYIFQKIQQEFQQQPLVFDVQFNFEKTQLLLTQLESKFSKLGAINLVAVEELKTLQSRFDELTHQIDDLEQTIEQLQAAMQSIDQETKHLFMKVFNQINTELQDLFPKVFSGGEASLSLEDDWQSGVRLMARPPGKRNSTLALLSGGEKALTALALVFAIFRLNPAPFCVLDEVDAPLDDANVNRFCNLVKELSQQVQFIYITHNKLAMTMATDLLGVTMPDAGSSKLVSVSLAQAEAYTV